MPEDKSQPLTDEKFLSRVKDLELNDPLGRTKQDNSQADQIEMWERLAFFDQLTGLFNAHTFMRELRDEVARAQRYQRPLSICVFSIDQFAEIKEKHGPIGCELILKYAAGLLKSLLREVDIAARYRGEQFAIILPETNNAGVLVVAERIREKVIKQPVKLTWQTADISGSIGLSAFPKHGQTADELLNSAFAALAKATAEGGNRVATP